jgi:hypothetical protein
VTFIEVMKLLTMASSIGLSLAGRWMLMRLWVPGFVAVVLGCAASTYVHHWFWIDVVQINRPDRNAWVWIAGHPLFLLCGLIYEYQEWKKRRGAMKEGG